MKKFFWEFNKRDFEEVNKKLDIIFYKNPKYQPGLEIRLENKSLYKCNIFIQKDQKTIRYFLFIYYYFKYIKFILITVFQDFYFMKMVFYIFLN
jgi:hypothetical protein